MSWMLTRSGRAVDLLNPTAEMIDIETDIAVSLSLLNRFDGHAGSPRLGFSVGQHSIMGADALLAETGSTMAAIAFLAHDAHEEAIGDIISPVAVALDSIAAEITGGKGRRVVRDAIQSLKSRVDAAIHARLGLAFPWPDDIAALVAEMDLRMLRTELEQLMPPPPRPFDEAIRKARPIPSIERIICWPAEDVAREWLNRLYRWHPGARP